MLNTNPNPGDLCLDAVKRNRMSFPPSCQLRCALERVTLTLLDSGSFSRWMFVPPQVVPATSLLISVTSAAAVTPGTAPSPISVLCLITVGKKQGEVIFCFRLQLFIDV